MNWFDHWCARRLDRVDAEAVVCYENAALHTFEAAKERGWTTILDAASFHHTWQDRYFDHAESESAHRRITHRKDREISLADHILTVSNLARQSYLDAGVPAPAVVSIPVGCDLSLFAPDSDEVEDSTDRPFTFIFAGHARRIKGTDLLLEASRRLGRRGCRHRLRFVGGYDSELPSSDTAERVGHVSQQELANHFRSADCLVLPSRVDSFGMVVVEAMAAGCPVLVSDQVGAKQAVTEGESGWIVPAEDPSALADRMRWCIEHPGAVRSMREAARADASEYSWEAYRERVAQHLQSLLVSA
jgi:glycosyltransferase involved in cell wall biosynthesis